MKTSKRNWLCFTATVFSLWCATPSPAGEAGDASRSNAVLGVAEARADETPERTSVETTNRTEEVVERVRSLRRESVVSVGKDVVLGTNESAEAVVVIGGSATIHGKVREAVVAIGGNVVVDGEVGDAAIVILGDLKLGPRAVVHREVVTVGGKVELSEGARIHGTIQQIDFGGRGFPNVEGLKQWVIHCAFKLRPLAPQVGWVWVIAGAFALVYLLVAIVFPRPVQACVGELTNRPATTFMVGLLTKLFAPLIVLVLALTGIGLLVVPFVVAALIFGAVIGKVALLEYLGGALGKPFGLDTLRTPVVACLVGIIFIAVFYMVPVLGLIMLGVTSLWGLGVAVTVLFGRLRRERRQAPSGRSDPPSSETAAAFAGTSAAAGGDAVAGEGAATAFAGAPAIAPVAQPRVPAPLAHPRAGFWERMAAAFLDCVLLLIVTPLVGPFILPIAVGYFAGMWTWKGTTIGGIVLKLQVVRGDGNPGSFLVAFVRALAAGFSAAVFFLGFFWIGWDGEKQAWHDKIAGTYVVRLPRSVPLVCL